MFHVEDYPTTLPEPAPEAPDPAATFASVLGSVRSRSQVRHLPARLTMLAALALCALSCVWPLDVSFVSDEAALLGSALEHNQRGELAEQGLMGSRGVRYGPVATWTYQALLRVTRDVGRLVSLHSFLLMGLTALALFWLARTLALPRAFALVVLLSPYLWLASRTLWDNNLCIPLAALALAGYAAFVARPRALPLTFSLGCVSLGVMVHLMFLALAAPLCAHLVLTRGRFLWRTRFLPLIPALLLASLGAPFFRALLDADAGAATGNAHGSALWFASLGGRVLGANGLAYFFGATWSERFLGGPVEAVANATSYLGHLLVWAGMVRALVWCARALRTPAARTPRAELGAVALGAWLAQTALNVATQTSYHPHYYNATFVVYALFAWFAVEGLVRFRLAGGLILTDAAALGAVLLVLFPALHATRGTRSLHYGSALGEQVEVARAMAAAHPDSAVATQVEQIRRFPHAPLVLLRLSGARPDPALPLRTIHVRYASTDPSTAALDVRTEPVPPPATSAP